MTTSGDDRSGHEVIIARESPFSEGVAALIEASDAFAASLYPPESCHGMSLVALANDDVCFLVARFAGKAIGCAAFQRKSGYAEVKRLFVADTARGLKLGERLMRALEIEAASEGIECLRLETGIHNVAALQLYRGIGYTEIGRFGDYPDDPLSVFMEKRIVG